MIKASVILKDNTEAILRILQDKALAFVEAGGQAIRSEAVARAPVASGNLRSSIQVEAYSDNGVPVSETGPTAEYAPYVEYGTGIYAVNGDGRKTPWWYQTPEGEWIRTRGGRAKPFMEPGFQAAIPTINRLKERILGL
ncbi:MAG: hypothetical protein C0436_00040 [Alphaproteobacteria bacterium]|nr:hypothetical protein [Alphaproteobacteria bacterium]